MSDVDTSREAIEALADMWERSSWAGGGFTHTRAAATLRALLAERDAARAEARMNGAMAGDYQTQTESALVRLAAAGAERDAARVQVAIERDIVHSLTVDVARWRDECERLRLGGCARGQTTTQWCAEAAEMMAQRDAARAQLTGALAEYDALWFVAKSARPDIAAAYRAGAEAMRERAAGAAEHAKVFHWTDPADHAEGIAAAIRALPLPDPEDKR
jgi:hypothetical protein